MKMYNKEASEKNINYFNCVTEKNIPLQTFEFISSFDN